VHDCCSAVDIIVFRYKYRRYGSLLQKIQFIANQLLDMNISVHLAWIPGHAGVGDNEIADKLAKTMSEDLYKGRVSASSSISIASTFHALGTLRHQDTSAPGQFGTKL